MHRIRSLVMCAASAACLLAVPGAAGLGQQRLSHRGRRGPRLRHRDRSDGRLVTNLARETSRSATTASRSRSRMFDNSPQPIRLIVMLDVSGSMEGNLPLLRAASAQLFTRLLPDDVSRSAPSVTTSRSAARSRERRGASRRAAAAITRDAPTPLWRAHRRRVRRVRREERGAPRDPGPQRRQGQRPTPASASAPSSQGDVIDRARDEDVMVYAIGLRKPPSGPGRCGRLGPAGLQATLAGQLA